MASPLELTGSLRSKLDNIPRRLRAANALAAPIYISRGDIVQIEQISRHIFVVHCPLPVYISTALSPSISLLEATFDRIQLSRCLDQIYYDIRLV